MPMQDLHWFVAVKHLPPEYLGEGHHGRNGPNQ